MTNEDGHDAFIKAESMRPEQLLKSGGESLSVLMNVPSEAP